MVLVALLGVILFLLYQAWQTDYVKPLQQAAADRKILLESPDVEQRRGVSHQYRKQLARCPSPTAASSGSPRSQRPGMNELQRGWNGQPAGRL